MRVNQFVRTHGERVKPDILKNRFEMKMNCELMTFVLAGLFFTQFSAVGKLTKFTFLSLCIFFFCFFVLFCFFQNS